VSCDTVSVYMCLVLRDRPKFCTAVNLVSVLELSVFNLGWNTVVESFNCFVRGKCLIVLFVMPEIIFDNAL
jgi:hypothetical protein